MSKNIGLKQQAVLGNDFTVSLDSKGKFTASDSFTAPYAQVQQFLPLLGAPCQRTGWTWLVCEGYTIEPQHGGVCKVIVQYNSSGNDGSFDFDTAADSRFKYSLAITSSDEPLETHPKYRNISQDEKELISNVKTGLYERSNKTSTHQDFYKFKHTQDKSAAVLSITSDLGKELIDFILKGVESYLMPRQTYTVRYNHYNLPSSSMIGKVGYIDTQPKGNPPTPSGRNWLFTGCNATQNGKLYTIELQWELSGDEGWEDKIYKK